MNIARDLLDARRPGHGDARALLLLAGKGALEMAFAPQGYRLDVTGPLGEQVAQVLDNAAVAEAPQLAYASEVTYPGENLFPGAYDQALRAAWATVAGDWRSHDGKCPGEVDCWHVETHVVAARDVFLTNDRPLLRMCERLATEHGVHIRALSPASFLSQYDSP